MAEIRIEPKRRRLGWLWLLLALIVVAVLAWYFLYPGRTSAPATAAPRTTGALDRRALQPRAFVIAVAATRWGAPWIGCPPGACARTDSSRRDTGGSYGKEG